VSAGAVGAAAMAAPEAQGGRGPVVPNGPVPSPYNRLVARATRTHPISPARPETEDAMANQRGLLPKAERDALGPHLARRLERWYENAYQDDNLFLTMARRPGLLDATWGFIKYIYGGGSSVEPELFELVRVKLAWNNRCVH